MQFALSFMNGVARFCSLYPHVDIKADPCPKEGEVFPNSLSVLF